MTFGLGYVAQHFPVCVPRTGLQAISVDYQMLLL